MVGTRFAHFFFPSSSSAKELEQRLSDFHQVADEALKYDTECQYVDAIQSYPKGHALLSDILQTYKKKLTREHRLMYERQLQQICSRQEYLSELGKTNQLNSAIALPTRFSVTKVLRDSTSLSRAQRATGNTVLSLTLNVDFTQSKDPATSPLSTDTPDAPAVEYLVFQERHLLSGDYMDDLIISDASTKQVLWILHALVDAQRKAGLEDTFLQRAGETMPGDRAIQTRIYKTKNAFNLRMQSQATGYALEQSDRGASLKDWVPRRFRYGDRQFVWKPYENWEALYETISISNVEGSKTGDKADVTIGECLCWGLETTDSKDRVMKAHIYFRRGLDQGFMEHCLASMLSRWQRQRNPTPDDTAVRKAMFIGGIVAAAAVSATGAGLGAN